MKLLDKVAIVTGGARGIGKAIALALAREGATVAIASRNAQELGATEAEIAALGRKALAVQADVSRREDVDRMVKATLDRFGTVDILVNNAGIQGPIGPVAGSDIDHWLETVRTNLVAAYLCCRAVLPTMLSHKQGKIIVLSGGGALYPRSNFSAYSASKAGVVRFTDSLAEEVKDSNVYVNAIAPGPVRTRLWDETFAAGDRAGRPALAEAQRLEETGGWASPEQAAALAVFLASPESDGLTGRVISAIYDKWQDFPGRIQEIMASDLYTMRRINPPK